MLGPRNNRNRFGFAAEKIQLQRTSVTAKVAYLNVTISRIHTGEREGDNDFGESGVGFDFFRNHTGGAYRKLVDRPRGHRH